MNKSLRVLIVEDSEDDALLMVRELRRGGFEVVHRIVETAETLRAAVSETTWDVVIADYSLPRMSGPAALKMVRDSGCDRPIILVSGAVGEEAAVAAMRAGAQDFLLKDRLARLPVVVERALAEAEVRDARHRADALLHSITELTSDPIFVKDRAGRYLFANAASVRITHLATEQLIGHTDAEVHHDAQQAAKFMADDQRLMQSRVTETVEEGFTSPDGTRHVFLTTKTPRTDSTGNVIGILVIVHDITKRKRMEFELRELTERLEQRVEERTHELAATNRRLELEIFERQQTDQRLIASESRFRQLANSLPQMVWTCGADGQCDFLSEQWLNYTGVPEAPQLGFGWLEQLHPDDREPTIAAWQAAQDAGSDFFVEFRIRRHDGVYRLFDTRAARLRDLDGWTVKWFGSNTDITERKQAEQRLTETLNDLHRLTAHLETVREDERECIAREIHDDLGQLLTGIKLDAAWLRGQLSNEATDDAAALSGRSESLLKTTDDAIQCVRRLGSRLRPSVLDTLGLVAAIEWLAQDSERRYGLLFDLDLIRVHADRDQDTALFRICQEALTNIARHAAATRVNISLRRVADEIVLEVSDDGRGFSMTGLSDQSFGLRGMRERAAMLHGQLDIDSQPGRGATIIATIPVRCNVQGSTLRHERD